MAKSWEERRAATLDQYGLTLADYDTLFSAQGGVCAICRKPPKGVLGVDHDHALERAGAPKKATVRGLLCGWCNHKILGFAHDNEALLRRAADYLANPPARGILNDS